MQNKNFRTPPPLTWNRVKANFGYPLVALIFLIFRTPSPNPSVPQGQGIYSSKAGSKSFDELDDILCDKGR